MSINPVLICYDGSDDAKLAIARAGDLFGARRAIVLSVWQTALTQLAPYAWGGIGYGGEIEAIDGANAEFAAKLAKEGADLAYAAGLSPEPLCVNAHGPIWQTILEIADEHDVAAIVMGSRGLSGLKSLMLGSVSGLVVHHANRPTLVVRHGVSALPETEPSELAGPVIG